MKRNPCTKVTPPEICREYENLLGTLHDCIINRDITAIGEFLIYQFLLLRGKIVRNKRLEYRCYRRLVHAERVHYGRDVPDEYTRVPIEVLLRHIRLGYLKRGFLLERIDPVDLLVRQGRSAEHSLDISIASLGAGRFDTQGKYRIGTVHETERRRNYTAELLHVSYEMVTRSHHHICRRVAFLDFPCGICNARGRIPAAWFLEDILGRNHRQLLLNDMRIFPRSDNPHILHRAYSRKTVDCQL